MSRDKHIWEGKGAYNYFDDLKYNYTKSLRHLDKDEKKEYNKLAKDFFSKISESVDADDLTNEKREDVGKYNTVKKAIKKVGCIRATLL
jgi:hypothetical protein